MKKALLIAALGLGLIAPSAQADPIETNPFGPLHLTIDQEPNGTTPGTGTLVVKASQANYVTRPTIWFGLRLMGSEDVEMRSFKFLPPASNPDKSCIISDFAGQNTPGWQGETVFGAETAAGSLNSHMRMIGGFVRPRCGDIEIKVTFNARPLVIYYAAFFAATPAPWSNSYGDLPWSTVPTGGNRDYEKWWNIWGTFDTLGYSNFCTNVTGKTVACG